MKKTTYPLSLSTIKINAYCPSDDMAQTYPGPELFDLRTDFLLNYEQSALGVFMIFSNDSYTANAPARGLRRNVSVSLIDTTDDCVMATTTILVNINRFNDIMPARVDLPFAYTNIYHHHSYKVRVTDVTSGCLLGEVAFRMFCGKNVSQWFNAYSAGISLTGGYDLLRSTDVCCYSYCSIRFNLECRMKTIPDIMPHAEVRIYYPDGTVESHFCKIECDDYDMDYYSVTMPFFCKDLNRGICYAELVCMDYAVAGFVFCTNGEHVAEAWTGRDLECLDEYSLEAASERFRTAIAPKGDETNTEENDDEDNASLLDNDFEKLLNDFIGSNTDNESQDEASDDANQEEEPEPAPEKEPDYTESFLAPLDNLTGLNNVKEKLAGYEKLVRFNKIRSDLGLSTASLPLHAMFLGAPGTGKTTVAKLMGKMLNKAGILSKGHVVVKERAKLIGTLYGKEEELTLEAIEAASGGILFIDEAYQLYQPNDSRDPGKFVIETLMTALADTSRRDWMLILAGYPDEMKRMFDMNPGLKSRIPDSNIYVFEDFSETELMEIAENFLANNDFVLTPDARTALAGRLATDYRARDKTFGNARHVINMIQTEILPAMAQRVITAGDLTEDAVSRIEPTDIPAPARQITSKRTALGFRA